MNKKAFILLLLVFYILSKSLLLNKYGIITKDGVIYACLSERFLDQGPSGLLDVTFPPLYPFSAGIGAFLLKPLYQFFPQTGKYFNSFELGGILASSFFHILLCLAVYRAGKKLYGFNVAAWASLFMLFHPLLFRFSGEVLTETIFAFLIFCGSYLMFLKDEPSFFSTFSSASCFGLSYYVKPEGIVVGILFFIVLVFQKKGFREKPLKPFLFLISLAMLSAPYVIYLSKETGQVLLSNKQNIVFYLSVKRMFSEMQSLEPTGVIAFVTAHPLHALAKLFRGLYYTAWNLPEAFFRIYFLFFIVFLFSRKEHDKVNRSMWVLIFLFFAGISFYNTDRRYYIPFMPLMAFDISRGFLILCDWIKKKLQKNISFFLGAIVLLIAVAKAIPDRDDLKESIRFLGIALGEKIQSPLIVSTDVRFAFYARGKHRHWEEFIKTPLKHNPPQPDILVIHNTHEKDWMEKFDQNPEKKKLFPYRRTMRLQGEEYTLFLKENIRFSSP